MSAHARSWVRQWRRAASVVAALLAVAGFVGAGWVAGPSRAAAQGPASVAGVARGPDTLGLLSQSPWVGPGQSQFKMDLAVTARDPGSLDLVVVVYQELITRSEFQAVLGGSFPAPYYQSAALPLSELARGPFGGAEVDVPVNSPSGGLTIGSTGVYPVQVLLERQGLTQGKPLTTFLVYVAAGDTSFKHLDVAVVLPLLARVPVRASGSLGPVPVGQASAIEAEAAAVFRQRAPVTLDAPAWVLEAMSEGPAAARRAVFELARSAAAGDEVLPSTWLPVDIGSLVASGLSGYLSEQLSTGASVQSSLLGVPPSTGTWAVFERASPSSLGALFREGVRQLVVPEGSLSQLPSAFQRLTFAQPAKLAAGGAEFSVIGADSEMSQRIAEAGAPGQAVLVANQVLAELAMIDLEAPSDQRGVVLLPSRHAPVSARFLSVLLSGLQGNPLLSPVTVGKEFSAVPVATTGGKVLVRHLVSSAPAPPLAGAGGLPQALRSVAEAGAVFGPRSALVSGLSRELFVSSSSLFSGRRRSKIIGEVERSAERALHELHLPSQVSITLTSRRARLPLTVLSGSRTDAHVRLLLRSEELSFVDARFPAGSCTASNPGSEECTLVLSRATTTLQVPVIVRTPGAFQLSLEIQTPDGTVVTAGADTIRSTAVSEVGLLLMVGAAAFLAVWWARNARHGRRARKLVSANSEGLGTWGRP